MVATWACPLLMKFYLILLVGGSLLSLITLLLISARFPSLALARTVISIIERRGSHGNSLFYVLSYFINLWNNGFRVEALVLIINRSFILSQDTKITKGNTLIKVRSIRRLPKVVLARIGIRKIGLRPS